MGEVHKEIKQYKIEEAADMVRLFLVSNGYVSNNKPLLLKKTVCKKAAELAKKTRGSHWPTIATDKKNYDIDLPDHRFIINNWQAICWHMAWEQEIYIIWNPDNEGQGVRIGGLEEYAENQKDLKNIHQGIADTYNKREQLLAKRLEEHRARYLGSKFMTQLPSGEE